MFLCGDKDEIPVYYNLGLIIFISYDNNLLTNVITEIWEHDDMTAIKSKKTVMDVHFLLSSARSNFWTELVLYYRKKKTNM